MRTTITTLGIAAVAGLFVLAGNGAANAAESGGPTHCPAAHEAPYAFTCTPAPDGLSIRIVAPSKGTAEQYFDKTGNLVCQKVQAGAQIPAGYPLNAPDSSTSVFYAVCDAEMSLVRALPPLPVGSLIPPMKG
ncbi:MAG: hypothetical protein HOQ24_11110 [Mycobacteriaceae bacterium]|nr:hypothetical protein [Mycobacteriaceae bacterium]